MFAVYKYSESFLHKLYRLALWQGYRLYLQQFCTLSLESIRDVEHFKQSFFSDGFDSKRARLTVRDPSWRTFSCFLYFSFFNKLCGLTHSVFVSFVLFRENASASSIWRERKVLCRTREGFKSCWASWDLCAFWCRLFCLMNVYAGSCTMVPSAAIHLVAVHITLTISGDVTSFLYFLRLVTHV